ncbi:FkbM family methyltransferase [Helicobacter bilis]|uniref:FkbM family methyltransferase n=1 Tax=Helicobacter bilis TaxID=37372 RepID=A0A4U8U7J0_9HELI|nr:FkbM family methyltransferase [Helicobacter bilis]
MLFKTNALFFEAEILCNKRKTIDDPLKLQVNHKEILYINPHCPFPADSRILRESFYNVCLLVHTFFLKEYYLEGFNPKNGETIIDCGGAIGDTALFFNAYYPDSDIHIFECSDRDYALLQQNIAINKKQDKLFAHKKAVGEKNQDLYFMGWYVANQKTESGVRIDCVSLDSFVKEHDIQNIGLIKMDIEGAEQDALKGAKETILKFKPKLMIPIYHLENDIVEIPKFLHDLGLPMEFRVKWTDLRFGYYDFVLFVRFL